MPGTDLSPKIQLWRNRAKCHRQEKERVKSRLREVLRSRAQWKVKSQQYLSECRHLRSEVKRLESQLSVQAHRDSRAYRHSYPVWMVCLCLFLRQQGICSLRVCASLMGQLSLILELNLGSPSPSSIHNWEHKLGLYHLEAAGAAASGQRWCLFIDESLAIGRQKVLLLLGLDLSSYDFKEAPTFSAVELLYIGVAPTWKADDIVPIIEGLRAQGHQFVYCPCDQGNNLIKSLKVAQITRIADCTHAFSKIVEKRYRTDQQFVALSQACIQMRKRLIISQYAALMPPTQRAKARFLNLRRISQWAKDSLTLLQQLQKQERLESAPHAEQTHKLAEQLQWLSPYQSLIEELFNVSTSMDQIFAILKHQGLCQQTATQIRNILQQEDLPEFWTSGVETYLKSNLEILPHIPQKICCCDIIESFFGKFKLAASQNPSRGITGACLRMANFGKKIDQTTIKAALETITVKQTQLWTQVNIPPNLLQMKNALFKTIRKNDLINYA